jgi:hypothetical protein
MANLVGTLLRLGWSILLHPKTRFFELPLSSSMTFKMWDRPGEWCTDAEIKTLVTDLKSIVLNSKDKEVPEYGVLLGDREDMKSRLISVVYQKGKPVAFSAQAHVEFRIGLKVVRVLHLGLVYVDKSIRGSGLTSLTYALPNVLLLLQSGIRSRWVSNVTQVPSIFGLVEDFYTEAYPNTSGAPQTFDHYMIANELVHHHPAVFGVGHDCEYDPKTQIIRNAYTGGSDNLKKSFEETVKSRNEKVNALFRDHLDYSRGDDYIQLAILDYRLLFRFIGAKGVKSRLGYGLFNLGFLFFTALLVPVARWLVPAAEEN